MGTRAFHILFLSTENSARSILAEAYTNNLKLPQLTARSAGSSPRGQVDPVAISVLEESQIPTDGLRSKSWDEFGEREVDIVISLCADEPSKDPCGRWRIRPSAAHWTVPDPKKAEGNESERRSAYVKTLVYLRQRIDYLRQFDEAQLDNLSHAASKGLPKRAAA